MQHIIKSGLLFRRAGALQQLSSRSLTADSIVSRNPYEELQVELDANSSRDNPMKINAFGNERTIACVCDDMHFMTLKKGPPVKCKCGYWFQLVDAEKFWLKESP
jgi:hypothetical protein